MKLNRVEIKNFRSIKDSTVTFDPSCRVLVGINESGKTNVLKALRLLTGKYKSSKVNDVRERVGREKAVTEAYVRFIFRLEKPDSDSVFKHASAIVLSNEADPEIVVAGTEKISLSAFCSKRNEGLYTINIREQTRQAQYWTLSSAHKLVPGWKTPSAACPEDYSVEVEGENKKLKTFRLVRAADFPDIPKEYLEGVTIEPLSANVGGTITGLVDSQLPEVVFWEYDENDLLPNTVEIAAFAANPDSCVPLKHMFVLAGIEEDNIKETIEGELKGTPNQIQNFLDQIAEQTTAHFREVWEEYRDVSFSLRLNANNMVPGVKEANTHDFDKRSDGFKRFVTFLLMISVKVKTDQMKNSLLLIDEPEIGLHPSGARYLRNELIKIAKQNYVVYSTHSIFMIDSGDIARHYIVKKKGEITTLEAAQASNIAEEEVLWNALGYSAFEVLKEKNLIFEGWKDKYLFQVALAAASDTLKRKFVNVGICHGKGASSIKAITPIIALARRDCIIVSDADAPALSEQKRYKADKGYGTWLTYNEVDTSVSALTGEDFVKKDFVVTTVNSVLAGSNMPQFTETDLPSDNGKLAAISTWLTTNGMSQEQAKTQLVAIKESIFEDLEAKNIEAEYTKLLKGIKL
ncbi:MAG: AAA family ATPase [Candidatus Pacebacteria bacterium]|nr:AAA family ATPase [Candidatus Paceibacterota bacterium]